MIRPMEAVDELISTGCLEESSRAEAFGLIDSMCYRYDEPSIYEVVSRLAGMPESLDGRAGGDQSKRLSIIGKLIAKHCPRVEMTKVERDNLRATPQETLEAEVRDIEEMYELLSKLDSGKPVRKTMPGDERMQRFREPYRSHTYWSLVLEARAEGTTVSRLCRRYGMKWDCLLW